MINKRAKGNRTFKKTIEYFQAKGYRTEKLEVLKMAWIRGKVIPVRTDILQSDLAAWNDKEFILAQVKSHKNDVRMGVKKYQELKLPKFIKTIIVLWQDRQKEPEVISSLE